ncbi:hypothetical protein LguiA_005670 [Lonicera macranthoides]
MQALRLPCYSISPLRPAYQHLALKFALHPGEKEILEVDVRPSDAINVARRCKVPLFVNKQIVLTDAIRTGNGMRRMRDSNIVYDASLDSAADGPDLLTEELDMARNMNLAIKEERYGDADEETLEQMDSVLLAIHSCSNKDKGIAE